jgi:hypothetical protein
MLLFRAPVKLFGYTGVLLFVVRLLFPPADFAGAHHVHSWVRSFGLQLDLTGYGFFEFAGLVFLISALAYHLVLRFTRRPLNVALLQVHFWSSLAFALFAIFVAHFVNRAPEAKFDNPSVQQQLNYLLVIFNWAFIAFIAVQLNFAIGAGRRLWTGRRDDPKREIVSDP